MTAIKVAACIIGGLLAPFICLFYRDGWFNTPDNPDSPHGLYEPAVRAIHDRFGVKWSDYYWLGIRNRAYGLRYALKPEFFRNLSSYDGLRISRTARGSLTITDVEGYREYVWQGKGFHLIYGYRMTPIYTEIRNNTYGAAIPFRKPNMDARPILSIRFGQAD